MCRHAISFVLVSALTSAAASDPGSGPTSRPARQTWAETVQSFALALSTDAATCRDLASDDVSVRQFSNATLRLSVDQLFSRMNKATLVGVHAYPACPKTFAADLAQDFAADNIPEKLRVQMTPPTDAAMARANQVAEKWIESLLNPAETESVAVFILLQRPSGKDAAAEPDVPVFILAKGIQTDDGFRFSRFVFGDPRFTSAEAKAQ